MRENTIRLRSIVIRNMGSDGLTMAGTNTKGNRVVIKADCDDWALLCALRHISERDAVVTDE